MSETIDDWAPQAGGVRERHLRETRHRIHVAALDLIEARGCAAVTVSEVATAAGVSRRTFFRYFRNKEDAVLAGHSRYFDAVRAQPLVVHSVAEALAAIERVGDAVLAQDLRPELAEHRRMQALISGDPAIRSYAVAQDREIADTLRDQLAELLPAVPVSELELIADLGLTVWRHGWVRWTSQLPNDALETPAQSHAAVRARFRALAAGSR
ncbi:TetR/AcrR family transcriptional regulator [Leucobacter sp. BZR 635]